MELGYRHPMGPLKLTDLVGLDVRLMPSSSTSTARWGSSSARPRCCGRWSAPVASVRKSGRGFYEYPDTKPTK
jgi:3-hydroxyacyl-CoA dehydrogenase